MKEKQFDLNGMFYKPKEIPEGFNWFAVLKDLSAGAPYTHEEYMTLNQMAGNWITCGCGQLCAELPRNNMGRPLDNLLGSYGTTFFHHIEEMKWCKALTVLHKIEARTTVLLEQQQSSSTQCAS